MRLQVIDGRPIKIEITVLFSVGQTRSSDGAEYVDKPLLTRARTKRSDFANASVRYIYVIVPHTVIVSVNLAPHSGHSVESGCKMGLPSLAGEEAHDSPPYSQPPHCVFQA